MARLPRQARVYSGPKQVPPKTTLASAMFDPAVPSSCTKTGHLRVTIMPVIRGGGVRDQKYTQAQTDLVQVFMSRGLSLQDTTALTDKLMPLAGLQRVLRLTDGQSDARWQEVCSLCDKFGLSLPPLKDRLSRAAKVVSKEARRRAAKQPELSAKSFRIQPSFFRTEAGGPAPLLTDLFPGCTGMCLVDTKDAPLLLQSFKGTCPDELALAVLGGCPDSSTCHGQMTCPAFNAQAEPLLLRCCLHQLGEKVISAGVSMPLPFRSPPRLPALRLLFLRMSGPSGRRWSRAPCVSHLKC